MTETAKLKPCAFCGSDDLDILYCDEGCCGATARAIECQSCGADLPAPTITDRWPDDETMAAHWNTRPLESELLAALEWITNVACGVGRAGEQPTADEYCDAIDKAKEAISKHREGSQ